MSKKKYNINFIPETAKDIEKAKEWYNLQNKNLGDEFVDEVEKTLEGIQNNPCQYAEKYKKMKQAKTDRFPYLISYIIEKLEIIVLSVLHWSRNPKEFNKRYK